MSDLFASVAGHRATSLRLYVPNMGPWFVDAELDEVASLAGAVEVGFGTLRLKGTILAAASGSFIATTKVRVVAGGGGWGKVLAPKSYHNDGGVRARTVAEDAAREAGEVLNTFASTATLGVDYVRRAGPASRALEDAAGALPWFVDYGGKTNVAGRASAPLPDSSPQLLAWDPETRLATLGVDDPAKLTIGAVLSDRLESPQTVRELEFSMRGGALRAIAWCGGGDATESRLVRSLTAIVERILARKLFGKYRYRTVQMASDRVVLQAVSKAIGLPDIVPITMRPGVAGMWASLALGNEVLVEFIAGRPTDPIVTAFAGKGEAGFVPTKIIIAAETEGAAPAAARKGDTVKVLLPPAVFSGTIGGSPATGVVSWVNPYGLGTIETGSGRVGIGT